nr:hypothetical protein [Tanacetum cinerariifolium]
MANLTFADSHNMVAYLEKSAENADFAEIVDFLNANSIRYTLTGIGSCGSPRRQDTILRDKPAQNRFERLSKQSYKPPLSRINSLRSEEDSMQLMELIELCTKLFDKVLALENNKTAQDLEITYLKKRVKRLEKKRKSRTPQLKRSINITSAKPVTIISASITTASVSVSTAEPSTPSTTTTTTTVIKDEDLTIAQTLMKMRSAKSKEKAKERGSKENFSKIATRPTRGVIMREANETTIRPTVPHQQKLDPKDKVKGKMVEPEKPLKKKVQIELDGKVARNLEAQLQAKLKEEERLARQKKEEANIALIVEWDDVQAMMDADHELAESLQAEEQGELTIKERAEGSKTRAEGSSKRVGEELEFDKSKKQKLDEKVEVKEDNDQKEAEIKMYMKIVSDDEVAIDAIPLATKPPIIINWKIIKEGNISSYHIIRADGSSNSPEEAYERVLWDDLKVMFELDIESKVWRELQGNKVTVWKLFSSCGAHFVRFQICISLCW